MNIWELPKDPQFYKWESPITEIFKQVEEDYHKQLNDKLEEQLMCKINYQVGYSVNKNELIKALNYDRDQYDKGYKDGVRETFNAELEDIKAEIEELIQHLDTDDDYKEIYGIRQAIEILDKHIKEDKNETD